ncbi:hypothetical protein GCM10009789_34620 [Kribbella sancticallisti]|uniref:Uncharacterized protein n=1 Tax=Kribbella sancticallisti TaxID=460087 RepID=A0ABP4PFC1_9ACTN
MPPQSQYCERDGEQPDGELARLRRQHQRENRRPGAAVGEALLSQVAGQEADHQGACGKQMREVGEGEAADGHQRSTEVGPAQRGKGGDEQEGQEFDGRGGAEEDAGPDRATAYGEDDRGDDQEGGEDVDMGRVAGFQGDDR